jgi:hypothetical protein
MSSVIDNYRVMLQPVASFIIISYNCHIFMVQATDDPKGRSFFLLQKYQQVHIHVDTI